MAPSPDIFAKLRLTPGQLRAVSERRFADAQCLLDSRRLERANGAIYMAGFVIECLLKALLLDRHPNLQKKVDPARLSPSDAEVMGLVYRRHDLDDMLGFLPEVQAKLSGIKSEAGHDLWQEFNAVCEEWTVYARYSPLNAKLDEAESFLDIVREVKKWLREL
ncbi:MAG: hypothetical protein JWL69_5190 [Phycisphaerales bacterium]|nr:hypothetical protein [Phycisphaerales bacterium]